MVCGDVERFEVVEIVFDLRPLGHSEAGLAEQMLHTRQRPCDGV